MTDNLPPDRGPVLSPYDFCRDQVAELRRDFNEKFDHEVAYRKQYGMMAAEATGALAEKGWVTLQLAQLKVGQDESKRMLNKVFATAFALLVSVLTLTITIIFGVLTR